MNFSYSEIFVAQKLKEWRNVKDCALGRSRARSLLVFEGGRGDALPVVTAIHAPARF